MDPPTELHPDGQWPRWEVFKQDASDRPHQAVGSVHATDADHALLAARNVFVRRPSAVSLWVAPAEAIVSVTAEELAADPAATAPARAAAKGRGEATERWLVFRKTGHRRAMTFVDHVGEVEAGSAEAALGRARDAFADEGVVVWWLVPERTLRRSAPEDAESWFAPAAEKTYKQQSAYGFVRPVPKGKR